MPTGQLDFNLIFNGLIACAWRQALGVSCREPVLAMLKLSAGHQATAETHQHRDALHVGGMTVSEVNSVVLLRHHASN